MYKVDDKAGREICYSRDSNGIDDKGISPCQESFRLLYFFRQNHINI
jgi:hypothetical protein